MQLTARCKQLLSFAF